MTILILLISGLALISLLGCLGLVAWTGAYLIGHLLGGR